MSLGLIGRKIGMMRIFTENGDSVPVTVVDVAGNRVTQIKVTNIDGYSAVQVAFGAKRPIRVNKPLTGHFSKAGSEAGSLMKEFRVASNKEAELLTLGAPIDLNIFQIGQKVDVSGVTIGKGYAGSIKRHHFSSNRSSHGNSKAHRKPGSIGMAQDPGRIFPGKKMSGHLGNVKRTVQNLEIIKIDKDRNLLLIKGAVPGAKGGKLIISSSVKSVTKS